MWSSLGDLASTHWSCIHGNADRGAAVADDDVRSDDDRPIVHTEFGVHTGRVCSHRGFEDAQGFPKDVVEKCRTSGRVEWAAHDC